MVRPAHGLPTGTDVSRFLMALHAQTKNQIASDILTRDWRDPPQVAAAFDLRGKASVPAASTQDSVWAGALSEAGIGQTALTLVRTLSIVGAAESRMRRVPFQTNVPRQTGTGLGGGWAPEGTSVAAVSYAFDTLTLQPFKFQNLSVVSRELGEKIGDESAERTLRDVVLGGHAWSLDDAFLNPSNTDGPARSPWVAPRSRPRAVPRRRSRQTLAA